MKNMGEACSGQTLYLKAFGFCIRMAMQGGGVSFVPRRRQATYRNFLDARAVRGALLIISYLCTFKSNIHYNRSLLFHLTCPS